MNKMILAIALCGFGLIGCDENAVGPEPSHGNQINSNWQMCDTAVVKIRYLFMKRTRFVPITDSSWINNMVDQGMVDGIEGRSCKTASE